MYFFRKYVVREAKRPLIKKVRGFCYDTQPAAIRLGESLPQCELYEDFPTNTIHMPDFVMGKNVILFGVPGAFCPGCSKTHVPEYVQAAETMKKKGIDEIVCVSVNDPYVMGAWAQSQNTKRKIRMLADPGGAFIYALGLGMNLPSLGGFRSRRFSMVLVNNVVQELHVEPDSVGLSCSLAHVLGYKNYIRSKSKLYEY
ncbi:hypothetical protein PYW08_016622 [Mythimna loreyi]|uniref:Uncharacterized protein n=1 Tax=Mythimna loreyi TaxID=667449 RepID=A0ACC2QZX7_9NEOP|nr:hypothetical protein PYW08_016622 [Mythimna loreyi]